MSVLRTTALLLTLALACAPMGAQTSATDTARPNIILIFADDLGYGDLSCYGQAKYKTPELDAMAKEGALFTDFYVTSPACSPSRASLLTGRYPNEVGVPKVLGPRSLTGVVTSATLVSSVLKRQGYRTAAIGKWHLGHLPQFMPLQRDFDTFFGLPYSNDMKPAPLFNGNNIVEQEADQATLTKRYTREALQIIENHAEDRKPFFIYLAHTFPHVPLHVSKEFAGKSGAGLYGDVMTELDWSVGQILRALKEKKLAENTLVIFTSDNGPWTIKGEHGGTTGGLRGAKGTDYEGGVRVPFIAWWPGKIKPGKVIDEPAITLDMLPTFAALAGADMADLPLPGVSLVELLTGGEGVALAERSFYFPDYYLHNPVGAVRRGDFKLVFARKASGKHDARSAELFNLVTDMQEQRDISADQPEVLERLTRDGDEMRRKFLASNPWKNAGDNKSTAALQYVTPR